MITATTPPAAKKRRHRKVHGRVKVMITGEPFTVEMRKDGIWFRKKHARNLVWIPFADVLALHQGQRLLEINLQHPTNSSGHTALSLPPADPR